MAEAGRNKPAMEWHLRKIGFTLAKRKIKEKNPSCWSSKLIIELVGVFFMLSLLKWVLVKIRWDYWWNVFWLFLLNLTQWRPCKGIFSSKRTEARDPPFPYPSIFIISEREGLCEWIKLLLLQSYKLIICWWLFVPLQTWRAISWVWMG